MRVSTRGGMPGTVALSEVSLGEVVTFPHNDSWKDIVFMVIWGPDTFGQVRLTSVTDGQTYSIDMKRAREEFKFRCHVHSQATLYLEG